MVSYNNIMMGGRLLILIRRTDLRCGNACERSDAERGAESGGGGRRGGGGARIGAHGQALVVAGLCLHTSTSIIYVCVASEKRASRAVSTK